MSICQRQLKLTLAVGGYRFFSLKRRCYFHYFGLFYRDNGSSIKYAGKGRGVIPKAYSVYSSFYFSLWSVQILQTLRVKIYMNRFLNIWKFILPSFVDFPEILRCCIRLKVFITLHRNSSRLWNSLNFMQLQAMRMLALNFRFVLVFDNSKIGVQVRNKLTLCKLNIALQTIFSLLLCIAPAHD